MQDIAKVFPGRDESTPQIVKAVVQLLYQVNRSAKKKWPDVLGSAFPDVKLFRDSPPAAASPIRCNSNDSVVTTSESSALDTGVEDE